MRDWKKLLITVIDYLLTHYPNNRTQKLDSRNYVYFANSVLFSKLTSKLKVPFFRASWNFLGQVDIW